MTDYRDALETPGLQDCPDTSDAFRNIVKISMLPHGGNAAEVMGGIVAIFPTPGSII